MGKNKKKEYLMKLLATAALAAAGLLAGIEACDPQMLIAGHEGNRKCVYKDSRGIPTIGIGFNLQNYGAKSELAAVGADYSKIIDGSECLSEQQVSELFLKYSLPQAQAESKRAISNYNSLCCNVKNVIDDLSFNLGGQLSSFGTFDSLIEQGKWEAAGNDLAGTAWCGQVGRRCPDDVGRIKNGCGGPGPGPSPGPSGCSDCVNCVKGGGGQGCLSKCESCGSACTNCIKFGGGKACASKCGGSDDAPLTLTLLPEFAKN